MNDSSIKSGIANASCNDLADGNTDYDSKPIKLNGSVAWAFAGQGSQIVGMGQDIYAEFAQTRDIFESTAAGFDLKEMCFTATAEQLGDTRYTQACMAAFAAAVVRVLKDAKKSCSVSLGLSLGEYCALHAADVFDAQTLLELLGYRGAIMADASSIESKMVAVLGLSDEVVESTVAEASTKSGQIVSCSNFNCPGQVVIGGQSAAVDLAQELLITRGAKRCMPIKTSGPFHTSLMSETGKLLEDRLANITLHAQKLPVVFNVTARPALDSQVLDLLTRQISSPVRFAQSLIYLEACGITEIIEIGPGKVLAGLVRKTTPNITVKTIQNVRDLKEVIA